MLEFLVPKEKVFFEQFKKAADKVVSACEEFESMLDDLENAESHARRIKNFEHEGDEITHRTVEHVHKTFVTPFDRHDIHRLASRLDDVLDHVDAAASRIQLYELRSATPECKEMAKVLTQAARILPKAVAGLERSRKKPQQVFDACIEINRLENEGDALLSKALARLFKDEKDVLLIMKWKEIYETLEMAIDRCEDVANLVEQIVIEQG